MKNENLKTLFAARQTTLPSNGWAIAHNSACRLPSEGFEKALVEMFSGWLRYADIHQGTYESGIGEDGVLGDYWAQIGMALRGLLNGSLGRLDGGTLDSLLTKALKAQGCYPDQSECMQDIKIPEKQKAAFQEILDYSWWSEALDWVESEGESRPGFDEHIYPALKLIADWIGWDAYQYDSQWTPEMGTPSNVRLTRSAKTEED